MAFGAGMPEGTGLSEGSDSVPSIPVSLSGLHEERKSSAERENIYFILRVLGCKNN